MFDISKFDAQNGNDEMAGYTKVATSDIVGKVITVEKAILRNDKNGRSLALAFDLDGDKLFIYTTSARLVGTADNVVKEFGEFPKEQIKIETEKYPNSINPGYKFVQA